MKKFISSICSLFLLPIACSFQICGYTQDGKEILLESDGTWKFSNAKRYTKSLLATKTVESRIVPLKVSFNPAQWDCKLGTGNEEFFFTLKNEDAGALLISRVLSLPRDMAKDLIIDTATKAGGEIKILLEKDRTVNGIPIKYFEYEIKVERFHFTYMAYSYSGEDATVLFAAFALKNDFPKYKNSIEELLNGIALSNRLAMDSSKN